MADPNAPGSQSKESGEIDVKSEPINHLCLSPIQSFHIESLLCNLRNNSQYPSLHNRFILLAENLL
jgi:hypothetical protein